jgi:hypothetical protein
MSRARTYVHEFVRSFPDRLAGGTLYVSVDFGSCAHRCFCGCGQEVYTQLTPRDWMMIYDGETVTLDPSIGNWSFPCRSHYWLVRGNVSWAGQWSTKQIERGRALDRVRKERHYGSPAVGSGSPPLSASPRGALSRFIHWLFD